MSKDTIEVYGLNAKVIAKVDGTSNEDFLQKINNWMITKLFQSTKHKCSLKHF
jgi:hypothetical protein